MTRSETAGRFGLAVVGVGLIGIALLIPATVFGWFTADDFRLKAALKIVRDDTRRDLDEPKICATPGIAQAASRLDAKELATLADFWVKLRNSAEQRADWYYVALIAAFAALMSGYEKLRQELIVGRALLIALGGGGLFAGFWIGHAVLYDVGRMNLVGQILECSLSSAGLGLKNGQYLMDAGFAYGALSAGIVFFGLMILFCCRLEQGSDLAGGIG